MESISWQDFEMVELKVDTLVRVEPFPEARRPAYKVWADFGPEIKVSKSSAQITALYQPEELVGRQIIAVVHFPTKHIEPFQSEFLLIGFYRPGWRRGNARRYFNRLKTSADTASEPVSRIKPLVQP